MKDKETDFQTEGLSKGVTRLIAAIAVAMSVYHLYTGYFGAPEAFLHRAIHLLFTMVLDLFPLPLFQGRLVEKISLDGWVFYPPDFSEHRLSFHQL